MLSHREEQLLSAIIQLCDGEKSCLVTLPDLIACLPVKKFPPHLVEELLFELQGDGFFDLICGERKGEKSFVICLNESATRYKRGEAQRRRDLLFKIFLALVGAVATFLFGIILKAIFH